MTQDKFSWFRVLEGLATTIAFTLLAGLVQHIDPKWFTNLIPWFKTASWSQLYLWIGLPTTAVAVLVHTFIVMPRKMRAMTVVKEHSLAKPNPQVTIEPGPEGLIVGVNRRSPRQYDIQRKPKDPEVWMGLNFLRTVAKEVYPLNFPFESTHIKVNSGEAPYITRYVHPSRPIFQIKFVVKLGHHDGAFNIALVFFNEDSDDMIHQQYDIAFCITKKAGSDEHIYSVRYQSRIEYTLAPQPTDASIFDVDFNVFRRVDGNGFVGSMKINGHRVVMHTMTDKQAQRVKLVAWPEGDHPVDIYIPTISGAVKA